MTYTISQLKSQIGLETLCFVQQPDATNPNELTKWVAHWDDNKRIRVVMHDDVLAVAKADPTAPVFLLKKEIVLAHKGKTGDDIAEYTRFVIVTPRNIVATF